jgi:predicted branched-subunit amino acid permease
MPHGHDIPGPPRPLFTSYGLRAGAIGVWPLLPSLAMYGIAVGIVAGAAGLTTLQATLMSAWVHAGGAQMASLQAWAEPVPVLTLCLVTLAMNARYLLLGATLRPWLGPLPGHQVYPSLWVLGDGNWALALREREEGRADAAFLLGSGLVMWATWVSSTAAGHAFGQVLGQAERWGLDFMWASYFATMTVAFMRTAKDVSPLVAAVVTAILVERLVPGPWYILAGGLAGSGLGALRGGHAA